MAGFLKFLALGEELTLLQLHMHCKQLLVLVLPVWAVFIYYWDCSAQGPEHFLN